MYFRSRLPKKTKMKKILLIALFLPPFAQNILLLIILKGIIKLPLIRQKYDKPIFMNIAASWSGVSNRIERNIFKDGIINNQFNSNFSQSD